MHSDSSQKSQADCTVPSSEASSSDAGAASADLCQTKLFLCESAIQIFSYLSSSLFNLPADLTASCEVID